MKKYQLILIFLMSYNFIKIIECHNGRAIRGLKKAKEIRYNLTVQFSPEPVTESIIDEFRSQYELGDNNEDKLNDDTHDFLTKVIKKYHTEDKNSNLIESLDESLNRIDEFYVPFNELLKSNQKVNFSQLEEYFDVVLSEKNDSVKYALNQMEVSTMKVLNLFHSMDKSNKDIKTRFCDDEPILRQQFVSQFFNVILNKAYKGHYLIISASKFLTRYRKENYIGHMKPILEIARKELQSYANTARAAMHKASRDIVSCNTNDDIKNKTYIEITSTSPGFIFDSSAVDSSTTCDNFNDKYDTCGSTDDRCFYRTCRADDGILKNCHRIDTPNMTVCLSEDNTKRYLSVESNSDIYGNQTAAKNCPTSYVKRKVGEHQTFLSFVDEPLLPIPNYYCYCNCERQNWKQNDVRAISLQWTLADYSLNRVITNLKFQEKYGMISLVSQTGVLLPGGSIDQKTVRWIQPYHPKPNIKNNVLLSYYYPSEKGSIQSDKTLIINKHYMEVKKGFSINLDDITVPRNHVIIGAKMAESKSHDINNNNKDNKVIELVVWSMEFNIDTGKLNLKKSHQVSGTSFMMREFQHSKRTLLDISNTNIPTAMPNKNIEISIPHQRVQFHQTNKKDDLEQSLVPFIDIRKVNTNLAMPLSTISLYHRGSAGSGGFIALKFQSYDIYDYFEEIIDDNLA